LTDFGILSPGGEQKILDFFNLSRHGNAAQRGADLHSKQGEPERMEKAGQFLYPFL
jgi:hypothetical protein